MVIIWWQEDFEIMQAIITMLLVGSFLCFIAAVYEYNRVTRNIERRKQEEKERRYKQWDC